MKIPWYKKINPLWWFGNYNDPVTSPAHAEFHPGMPLLVRRFLWFCRNPMHNLFAFVIGFDDRPEIVNAGKLWPKDGQRINIVLPLFSFRTSHREGYIGWRNGTNFGIAFRKR